MRSRGWEAGVIVALAAALVTGCDTDTQVTGERADAKPRATGAIAYGSEVASCEEAVPTGSRIGGSNPRRRLVSTTDFGMLQNRNGFAYANPAKETLGNRFAGRLLANAPASVLRGGSVTVTIPAGERDEAGLLYGSLERYQHGFAQMTFESCPGGGVTSWSGGLVLARREAVTLLVTDNDGDEIARLRVGEKLPASNPVATGSGVARCSEAMLGDMRISSATLRRDYNAAGRLALLESPIALRSARPAGAQLAARYRNILLTKIPATVMGTGGVTLTVPVHARDRVGLFYGSLSGYREPLANVTFMPCRDRVGTSWPGGLALSTRQAVTLRVSTEEGERTWWLRVGD